MEPGSPLPEPADRSADTTPGDPEPAARRFAREAGERAHARLKEASASQRRLDQRHARHQEAVIRREVRQSGEALERFDRVLAEEHELDAADEAAFMRGQIIPMLDAGWTVDELGEVGISPETLASLGILHHAARRPAQ